MNSINLPKDKIVRNIQDFIVHKDHSCLMARSVMASNSLRTVILLNSSINEIKKLYLTIEQNRLNDSPDPNSFSTIIAVFPEINISDAILFEDFLWEVLYKLNSMDKYDWDPSVSKKLQDNNYSFSIAGTAFYVVGMFPNSPRKARRMPYVSLAFNLHRQFERLRKMGAYEQVKKRIRNRDKNLQGDINPMLEDFGESSEARQYSGRMVKGQWKCPYFEKPNK
ncbi:guanitoxin biosynthesis heme-dependent pre-guanitoxin N-hydroxylase GntA [Galbibacter pacificus]|uniref:YqcI/YcgG family protein n=1 Tax=Galbibacter pacificus TaxID=2996052 RepID=A0ABT6FPR0_9FLAO|nr:guanitoxin biosynthesis heme-dependent pre-guanitoxin N-hydroxylase GntA [Galbibacter pacificus]MDG3582280.1 guanitoxin biosynthesis heme-dependent pre-guanitoxin N-hydroxylase GntA [Galbibacter pacificus]MDG3585244.1 YqcI/YcgG family protein [Galbibacter pacificus]